MKRAFFALLLTMLLLTGTVYATTAIYSFEMRYINETNESISAPKDDDEQYAYVRGTDVYGVSTATDGSMLLGIRIRHTSPDYGATEYVTYQLNSHNVVRPMFVSATAYTQAYMTTGIEGDYYYLRGQYDDASTQGEHYFCAQGRFTP